MHEPHQLDERTPAEYAALIAAVEASLPVPMRDPKGRTVIVGADRVAERLAAGYTQHPDLAAAADRNR
jgi:hypothetical protein